MTILRRHFADVLKFFCIVLTLIPRVCVAQTTKPCMAQKIRATISTANDDMMTNANFFVRTTVDVVNAGCSVAETAAGVEMVCVQPICVVDYRLALSGLLASKQISWTLEGGRQDAAQTVWQELASGRPNLASEPAESPNDPIPTYKIENCNSPCTPASPAWVLLKSGSPQHLVLTSQVSMAYAAFPFYPMDTQALRKGLALAYSVNTNQVAVQSLTQTPPAQYNKSDLQAQFNIWSYVELPPVKMPLAVLTEAEQLNYHNAITMSNEYLMAETSRISDLSTQFGQSAGLDALTNKFSLEVPPSSYLINTPTRSIDIRSVVAEPTPLSYPVTTFGTSGVASSVASAISLGGTSPVLEAVTTLEVLFSSYADRQTVAQQYQGGLQQAFANAVANGVTSNNVGIDVITFLQPTLTQGQQAPMLVKIAAMAQSTSGLLNLMTLFKNSADMSEVSNSPQTSAGLVGSLTGLIGPNRQYAISGPIVNARPLPDSSYVRAHLPGVPPPVPQVADYVTPAPLPIPIIAQPTQEPEQETVGSSGGSSASSASSASLDSFGSSGSGSSDSSASLNSFGSSGSSSSGSGSSSSGSSSDWPWWAWLLVSLALCALLGFAFLLYWVLCNKKPTKKRATQGSSEPLYQRPVQPSPEQVMQPLKPSNAQASRPHGTNMFENRVPDLMASYINPGQGQQPQRPLQGSQLPYTTSAYGPNTYAAMPTLNQPQYPNVAQPTQGQSFAAMGLQPLATTMALGPQAMATTPAMYSPLPTSQPYQLAPPYQR